jgi:hypothetical protein
LHWYDESRGAVGAILMLTLCLTEQ